MASVEADNRSLPEKLLASGNSRLQQAAVRIRKQIRWSGSVLGFDRFEITYLDDDNASRLVFCADQKSAGFQAPPRKQLKSCSDRHSEAVYNRHAEADRYGLPWDFPDKPTIRWRFNRSVAHDDSYLVCDLAGVGRIPLKYSALALNYTPELDDKPQLDARNVSKHTGQASFSAGHFLMMESPEGFNRSLEELLATVR